MLFRRMVDDQVYGQPLVVANVGLRGGTHDLVFVTTVNNSVMRSMPMILMLLNRSGMSTLVRHPMPTMANMAVAT